MASQGDLFSQPDAPKKKAFRKLLLGQTYEQRAQAIEAVASKVDGYRAQDAEHAQFLREHAEHLRNLAHRMRTEKRPLA